MKTKPSELSSSRPGERGAALVTALLVSMLLLAAGGALVITTGMSASNAVDSTAEAEAYYAADAGIQAALNVMRRNKPASAAGVKATFRNLVCGTSDPCTNAGGNLSLWLTYQSGVVRLSASSALPSFDLNVSDPSKAGTDTLAADYQPRYLLVRSVGHGPKGATKVLEMMVDRFRFTYDAPAPLVLRESEDGVNHVVLTPGAGTPNLYSGLDEANPSVTLPAVCVGETFFTATTDFNIASIAMSGEDMTGGVGAAGPTSAIPWPAIVADAATAYQTVYGDGLTTTQDSLKDFAFNQGCPGNSDPLSGSTFIDGNCTVGPQNSGSGFLVITGTLTMTGGFDFQGLIFVLGSGRVVRSGGGGGTIEGGILAANFGVGGAGGFGPVVFDTGGGGNSKIKYNSKLIEEALALAGPRAVGVVEK